MTPPHLFRRVVQKKNKTKKKCGTRASARPSHPFPSTPILHHPRTVHLILIISILYQWWLKSVVFFNITMDLCIWTESFCLINFIILYVFAPKTTLDRIRILNLEEVKITKFKANHFINARDWVISFKTSLFLTECKAKMNY